MEGWNRCHRRSILKLGAVQGAGFLLSVASLQSLYQFSNKEVTLKNDGTFDGTFSKKLPKTQYPCGLQPAL